MSYTYLTEDSENCISLQEQGEVSSADTFSDIPQYVLSRLNLIPSKSCSKGSETESCQSSQSGQIVSQNSTENRGGEKSMSSAEDSPVQEFLQLGQITTSMESKMGLMTQLQDFGLKCCESLKKLGLVVSLSKTHLTSEVMGLSQFSKDLGSWGMMRDGVCLNLYISVQTTTEPECGYLPTPTSHNAKEGAYPAEYTRKTPTLAAQIGGKVNPEWNEWRMGWPIAWTDLEPLEMDKIQRRQQQHGEY